MSAKVLNKMWGFLGLEDEYEDEEDEIETEITEENEGFEPVVPASTSKRTQNKVVNIHTAVSAKVTITKPKAYEEATEICDDLKNRKIVVVNTTELDAKVAQRLLDFMGGASYALGGELQEIERGVYILSPSNVEVTNELKSELTKGLFNWTK